MNSTYVTNTLKDFSKISSDLIGVRQKSEGIPRYKMNNRELSDYELIINGALNPLEGFMTESEYNSVVDKMSLPNGALWTMPITLSVSDELMEKIKAAGKVVLLHPQTEAMLAILKAESIYKIRKSDEATKVFGSSDSLHPAISYLNGSGNWGIGGSFEIISPVYHYDFTEVRRSPQEIREFLSKKGVTKLVAFQTRNPMHKAHYELTKRAMEQSQAHLLLHPAVGPTKDGDIDHFTRVRCYKQIIEKYPAGTATLSLLPLAMRMAGPKEALHHMIIRKNYGATHFIVGRDHAGPGKDSTGKSFYDPNGAQILAKENAAKIGIEVLPFNELLYSEQLKKYVSESEVPPGSKVLSISGTEFRDSLRKGSVIPEWFSFPEVVTELKATEPPAKDKGFCIFFTGFSGSGKTTLSYALIDRLKALLPRPITLLDGDEVRLHLSKGLGFSKEDRDTNILRIGYVASLVVKHRGMAICAPIAPYDGIRKKVRDMVSQYGNFIQIYVSTSIEDCEKRDPKGLYSQVRKGQLKNFTGIDDPYEVPTNNEMSIDTGKHTIDECLDQVVAYLRQREFI